MSCLPGQNGVPFTDTFALRKGFAMLELAGAAAET
jgi:hypothetical protein